MTFGSALFLDVSYKLILLVNLRICGRMKAHHTIGNILCNYPLCKTIIDVYDEEMSKYADLLDEFEHLSIKWHNR